MKAIDLTVLRVVAVLCLLTSTVSGGQASEIPFSYLAECKLDYGKANGKNLTILTIHGDKNLALERIAELNRHISSGMFGSEKRMLNLRGKRLVVYRVEKEDVNGQVTSSSGIAALDNKGFFVIDSKNKVKVSFVNATKNMKLTFPSNKK